MQASWTTDNGRFEFRLFLKPDDDLDYALRVEFYYVNRQGIPYPLWEIDPMPYNKQVMLENLPVVDEHVAHGWLRLSIVEQANGSHLVLFAELFFKDHYDGYEFEGPIFVKDLDPDMQPPSPILPPPVPDDPEEAPDDLSVEEAAITNQALTAKPEDFEDLFPYVYMRSWPRLNSQELRLMFTSYQPSATSPPVDGFYETLVSLSAQHRREDIEQEANKFLEAMPPYATVRLYPDSLHGPIQWFNALLLALREGWPYTSGEEVATFVKGWLETKEIEAQVDPLAGYLTSSSYLTQKEAAWQTYFALTIKLGYEHEWLDELTRTLIMCHVLETLVAISKGDPPPKGVEDWLYSLIFGSILLPNQVFPLPPYRASSSPPSSQPAVSVYAIGDLQLVQQKFSRYELGEIAHIVNVVPGEKKEVVTRKLDSSKQVEEQTHLDERSSEDITDEQSTNLEQTVQETLAATHEAYDYKGLKASYGPPTNINIDGNWTRDFSTTTPGHKSLTEFAKKILNRSSQTISARVSRSRQSHILSEQEEITTSVYDNLDKDTPICVSYRWLNKVYSAQVVNYGERLMLLISLKAPAARYLAQVFNLTGDNLEEPLSLAQQGIRSFQDITPDNYSRLAADYEMADVELPPAEQLTVSDTLSGSESKLISLPDGYEAKRAYVTYLTPHSPQQGSIRGIIGRTAFPQNGARSTSETISMAGESTSVPVSVSISYPASPPVDALDNIHVAIEIDCEPSERTMDMWRVKMYQDLQQAAKQKRVAYYAQFDHSTDKVHLDSNPLKNRHMIREELKKGCLAELLKKASPNLETPLMISSPPIQTPESPRYDEYLEAAFEWKEMTYSFTDTYTGPSHATKYPVSLYSDEDQVLTAFLQSDSAQVILPVRKHLSYGVLYFLCTGDLWIGEDILAPALDLPFGHQPELVHHLTEAFRYRIEPYRVLDTWEVTLPTTLQVLKHEDPWLEEL